MKRIILLLLLVSSTLKAGFDFFTSPDEFSPEQLHERQKTASIDMNFCFSPQGSRVELLFYRKNAKTNFRLTCYDNLPAVFSEKCKEKFSQHMITVHEQEKKVYIFEYPYIDGVERKKVYTPSASLLREYQVHESRKIDEGGPLQIMDLEQFAEFIRFKNVLFYTGAGISAHVVPTLDQLLDGLEISSIKGHESLNSFMVDVLENSQKYHQVMGHFFRACLDGEPTPCHYALAALAKKLSCKIITENVDLLHLKTGIAVPVAEAEWIRSEINPETFQNLDAVICIGLRSDERGFLAWYKKYNPKGILIAVNLKRPEYLGLEDFFVCDDAQKIIPQIEALI